MPLQKVEAELALFIQEVIERTKLMSHYHKSGYSKNPRVNIVGHSMSGMIISGYLECHKKKAPIDKVVTLATPYQSSLEAVIKIATGTVRIWELHLLAPANEKHHV